MKKYGIILTALILTGIVAYLTLHSIRKNLKKDFAKLRNTADGWYLDEYDNDEEIQAVPIDSDFAGDADEEDDADEPHRGLLAALIRHAAMTDRIPVALTAGSDHAFALPDSDVHGGVTMDTDNESGENESIDDGDEIVITQTVQAEPDLTEPAAGQEVPAPPPAPPEKTAEKLYYALDTNNPAEEQIITEGESTTQSHLYYYDAYGRRVKAPDWSDLE